MSISPGYQSPRSILDLPDEAGGGFGSGAPMAARRALAEIVLDDQAVAHAVRDALLGAFDAIQRRTYLDPFAAAGERNSRAIAVLRAAISEQRRSGGPLAAIPDDADTLVALFAATLGWGPAQRYLDDPRVNEVKINNCAIMVQEAGRPFVVVPERFASSGEVRSRAIQLAAALGVQLDAAHPQETLPVAHGTRVHATIHPRIAESDGALVCIRRGRREAWDLSDLESRTTVNGPLADLLRLLCRAQCSFLIAGRTGTGKTAVLEALANSWPDTPHIITIEDHTLEIGVRATAAWTRELVDTQRDPHAFGRAAREALRQTPGLLLPGETRGSEAGAILALALSGHSVITTLHARTAAEAVTRFAGYASQPGAYMYESRRNDALRDSCSAFDVVVRLDAHQATGRRIVAELALLDGTLPDTAEPYPNLIPLATSRLSENGDLTWHLHARAEDGRLVWQQGVDQTPADLRERLTHARADEAARNSPTLAGIERVLERAEQLLAAGETERALSALRACCRERRENRLLDAARQAIERDPEHFEQLRTAARSARADLEQSVAAGCWAEALQRFEQLMRDLALAAAAAPPQGWAPLEARIRQGLSYQEIVDAACLAAEQELLRDNPRAALDRLNAAIGSDARFAPAALLAIVRLRERALEQLLACGEGTAEAVRVVRERRAALENDIGRNHPDVPGVPAILAQGCDL